MYHKKYSKYKKKYLDLERSKYSFSSDGNSFDSLNNNKYLKLQKYKTRTINKSYNGSTRYECKPQNRYSNICIPDTKGYYKSKESCVNDCENKYINHHLTKANIKGETSKFYLFIKDIIKNENFDVYIKGGNVIGLYILKMIYNKHKNNDDKFINSFSEFLKLNLVQDWDFASYTKHKIDDEYRNKLDSIAEKYILVPRAKTFILYQTKRPILIDKRALFEIAVLDSDNYSKLEIPMTSMKIKVHEYNLKYIFMFAKSFLAYKLSGKESEFDFDIIKKMISKINVVVHPHKEGLYDPSLQNFDTGGLNNELISFINDYTLSKKIDKGNEKKLAQFLVIHISDPFRLLYRFPEKNVPKTEKIKNFIKKELDESIMPSWLMDTGKMSKIVKEFVEEFGQKVKQIYINEFKKSSSVDKSMSKVIEFVSGINFNRTKIEFKNFTDDNKDILKLMLSPLIKEVGVEKILSLDDTNNTIRFFKFLVNKLKN
jgi:hypothetical protein